MASPQLITEKYLKEQLAIINEKFNKSDIIQIAQSSFIIEPYITEGRPKKFPLPLTNEAIAIIENSILSEEKCNFNYEDIHKLVNTIFGCRKLSSSIVDNLVLTIYTKFKENLTIEILDIHQQLIKKTIEETINYIVGEGNGQKCKRDASDNDTEIIGLIPSEDQIFDAIDDLTTRPQKKRSKLIEDNVILV